MPLCRGTFFEIRKAPVFFAARKWRIRSGFLEEGPDSSRHKSKSIAFFCRSATLSFPESNGNEICRKKCLNRFLNRISRRRRFFKARTGSRPAERSEEKLVVNKPITRYSILGSNLGKANEAYAGLDKAWRYLVISSKLVESSIPNNQLKKTRRQLPIAQLSKNVELEQAFWVSGSFR